MQKSELDKIQANLSFSYLHAVVSRAGGSCEITSLSTDHIGIDARATFIDKESDERVNIDVQLKSSRQKLPVIGGRVGLSISVEQYHQYTRRSRTPFVLVLLCVPEDVDSWLSLSENELVLRKCAYWTGLIGSPPCDYGSITIHIPEKNILSVEQMQKIVKDIIQGKELRYG